MLSRDESIGLAEAANDEGNLAEVLKELHPDVVITDIQSAYLDAMGIIKLIKETIPEATVIVLTASENDSHVIDAVEAGAQGYLLLRETTMESLQNAIRCTDEDAMSIKASLLQSGLAALRTDRRVPLHGRGWPVDLTSKELQVLKLIAEGGTNEEIAQKLSLSIDTVKGTVQGIVGKLNARGRTMRL
jgi:two-component system response regulator DegU